MLQRNASPDSLVICDSWKSVSAVPKSFKNITVLGHGQEYLNKQRKHQHIQKALDRAALVISSSNATAHDDTAIRERSRKDPNSLHPTYMLGLVESGKVQTPNRFSIFSLSRIERRKGLFQSAQAISQLPAELRNRIDWRIAGSGPDLESLKQHCCQLGMAPEFLGQVDDSTKAHLFASSDLFLMPSYREGSSLEGFGITYIEAAAYGVPSIGGIAGGAGEAVIDGQTGWSVDGASPEAIRGALEHALCDPDELAKRGALAATRFKQELAGPAVFTLLKAKLRLAGQSLDHAD